MAVIDQSSRGATGGRGWGEAEEGRGAWQEATDGTVSGHHTTSECRTFSKLSP